MCGICGYYGFKDEELIGKMCQVMSHRGPDQEGFYIDDFISLGHRRLSIIDLSERGRQPMGNEDGSIRMIYNGEIYNYLELKSQLEKKGHRFYSHSDGEVIVHAYEEFGIDCVRKLRGMFSIAIWDSRDRKLILARDRLGIKPLYYTIQGDKLLFASEIKAILQHKGVKREIDYDAYHTYLRLQYQPGADTMFKGIKKLLPGHVLIREGEETKLQSYWDLKESPSSKDNNLSARDLRERIKESVRMRLMSDVPLGVLLSGGLDSSLIVALMSEGGNNLIKTFSVGFDEPGDELSYARLVSEHFRTGHQEFIFNSRDLVKTLPRIVWHMDEPIADGGAIPTFLMSEFVKEKVKVVLVGEGADEIFAGYPWHRLGACGFKFIPRKLKAKLYGYLTSYYRPGREEPVSAYEFRKALLGEVGEEKDFLKGMLLWETRNQLPNCLLMKVDKMTMAHSLEARVPYLDHELVEWAMALPSSWKLRRGRGKHILRQIASELLPQEIVNRKKRGFIVPLTKWLLTDLKEYVLELLLDKGSHARQFLDEKDIESLFANHHFLERIEKVSLLWRLVIFELWYKTFIKREDWQ